VIGDLRADNMVVAGSQIHLEGNTILKDALVVTADVDFEVNSVTSSLYIIDYIDNITGIKKGTFDYCLYFLYDLADEARYLAKEGKVLDQEAEIKENAIYFKAKEKVWVNNEDVLKISEIKKHITDKKTLSIVEKMIDNIKE